MDFKVKFFHSEHLNEIETRRFKIDYRNYTLDQFLLHLKKLINVDDNETIYVSWKDKWEWHTLARDEDWFEFIDNFKDTCEELIYVNIYCGNVHINATCDICGNVVIGYRHKCLQCDNFDVCQVCFQSKPDCHNEHCFLLLRTPEDSNKCLNSLSVRFSNSTSSFQVKEIDLQNMSINLENGRNTDICLLQTKECATQTDVIENRKIDVETTDKIMETDPEIENQLENNEIYSSKYKSVNFKYEDDNNIPKEYLDNLPQNIKDGLKHLRSMGFRNINGTLIALLVENKGSVIDVIEELEYSLKTK